MLLRDPDSGSPAALGDVEILIRNLLEERDLNRRASARVEESKAGATIVRLPLPP